LSCTTPGAQNEQGDLDWLSNWHPNPVSTHQLIQRSGTIVQVVANVHRAWHAGESSWLDLEDCNTWSIGVEICNNGMGEAYTEAQLQTVAETVAYNCARYHIPDRYVATHKQVRNEYIKRHGPAERKYDPWNYPIADMWVRVAAIRANWPAGWVPLWSHP
jgi:N-acetylmuramoyl-L-alanine amidase